MNGESSGRVEGGGGRLQANIRFYFEANPNQMPMRFVDIRPGDGSSGYDAGAGSYPNHRGKVAVPPPVGSSPGTPPTLEDVCKAPADAANFGESTEACFKKAFRFRILYNCPSGSDRAMTYKCDGAASRPSSGNWDDDWETDWNANGCWDPSANACVFRPRIQVQDNWGYCTGVCPGGEGGDRCYAGIPDECAPTNASAWVSFDGRIVVTPP